MRPVLLYVWCGPLLHRLSDVVSINHGACLLLSQLVKFSPLILNNTPIVVVDAPVQVVGYACKGMFVNISDMSTTIKTSGI